MLKTIRTHWKTSALLAGLSAYLADFAMEKRRDNAVMRDYCLKAAAFGRTAIEQPSTRPYHVTVILNPAANSGKARVNFEKFCAPILHLAGIKVSVVRTESQGQAKELMQVMDDTDAVLVAGGDGTLMETVTGMLRRPDADQISKSIPIGVLPVGKTNHMGKHLFAVGSNDGSEVALMAEASMGVVKQLLRPLGVIEVKNVDNDESKPLFGLREIQIGAFSDTHQRLDKYWYWAFLKKYVAYIFAYTTAASNITWQVASQLASGQKVAGIDSAVEQDTTKPTSSWWSYLKPWSSKSTVDVDNGIANKDILDFGPYKSYNGLEIAIESANNRPLGPGSDPGHLTLSLGPDVIGLVNFLREGWSRERSRCLLIPASWATMTAPAFRWQPDDRLLSGDKSFYLDGEEIDIRGPIQATLLPDHIVAFCSSKASRRPVTGFSDSAKKWWQRSSFHTVQHYQSSFTNK